MFFIKSVVRSPEPEGGNAPPAPEPVKPEDARTYLTGYGHDAAALKTLADDKVIALHTAVTGHIKTQSETAAKAEFEKRTRPEHIPEQFWDAEKREIRHDAMAKAWSDTRTALQNKAGQAPKTPDEYTFTPPEGVTLDADDKLLGEFKKVAHAAGLSNEAFGKIAGEMMKSGVLQPAAIDVVAEKAKLGPQADAIIAANTKWGQNMVEAGVWTQEDFNELMILGSTAEGIRALNKMREYYGGERIPTGGESPNHAQSVAEWYAKRNALDPQTGKLRIETDPAYRKQTDEEAVAIFGTGPARSSIPGAGMPR
jgi:hypothetical protein